MRQDSFDAPEYSRGFPDRGGHNNRVKDQARRDGKRHDPEGDDTDAGQDASDGSAIFIST